MDLSDENEDQIKYYKCKERLFGSLNVVQKDSEGTFILWNKYQIYLYEGLNFEYPAKEFTPEFQISQIVVSDNYLACVDCTGNVHTTSLKFKNPSRKMFRSSFQPREQGVLHCTKYSPESALCLKLRADTYNLSLHNINADFELKNERTIKLDDKDWTSHSSDRGKCIIVCKSIPKENFSYLSTYFEENLWTNHSLVLITFEKLTVYACLFSETIPDDDISLKKLYTSPSEICDIKIVENKELEVLFALTCGTIVSLQLNNHNNTPNIIHLNSAVSKIEIYKNSIIYTDSMTMWKAVNRNSKENISFQQFFVKEVKDFVIYENTIICTTFTNLIYTFPIEDNTSYLNQDKDPYCPAEKLVNDIEYLLKINQEIERNKEIITKINQEGNYLTAVSLSRRQDIMDKMIEGNVIVYENYEEVIKENADITLTEEMHEYFKTDSIMFLVKISATTIQHSLSNILNDILENLKIHITLTTPSVVKTTTIKLEEPLKKLQVLIPMDGHNISHINVEIKFISEIPGALNKKETVWTVLHKKVIALNAEHFIKTNSSRNKNKNLKEPKENIDEMISKTIEEQHGDLFKVTDMPKNHYKNPSFYVKLPYNYNDILKQENTFRKYLNPQKANYMQKLLTTEEFLKSKINAVFEISKEKVYISILNDDFSNPLLKISCNDIEIALEIRNFFGRVFYEDAKCSEEEFISNAAYTTTENVQKSLKQCSSFEDCLVLAERLQKNVIANLPL